MMASLSAAGSWAASAASARQANDKAQSSTFEDVVIGLLPFVVVQSRNAGITAAVF
jgi:hypothetical protein